jgi:protein-S-isoprenylcysteine O-methyltransferase Ste14
MVDCREHDFMSLAWLNLVSLHVSAFLFVYLYILSAMPVTRAEKRGEKAWKECKWLRILAGFFESVTTADMILWIWFPVPNLAWSFHPDPLVGRIVAFAIAVPSSAILMKGIKDAGQETMRPSKSTKMFGGIYQQIRHPQTLGEMPLFIAIALFINSLFLTVWATLFVSLGTPILIHYEEKDLLRRFGDAYLEYRRRTRGVIPRFWKRRTEEGLA